MFLLFKIVIGLAVSYLIGSIPSAYVFGKLYKGIDIREHGSGNVGATNAFRVLGKGPGITILLIDIAKGMIATTLICDMLGLERVILRVLLGVAVVCGHNWTVFLGFKGGKGIATSLGVFLGLTITVSSIRAVVIVTLLAWVVVFLVTRFVSLSSIIASIVLPIAMAITNQQLELVVLGIVFCILVILRHRPNIKRLILKEEPRVNLRFKKAAYR